ncbi:hypothetical protein [Flavobacterium sp. FlaQc-48]|uniref:hypothetical protein n=1 Tax=Flavobacterium sp. FlaQc-48 TaxID=3374181 RepID=UPI003756FE90
MKQKYFILVFMFLCMLCGHGSYALTSGESDIDEWSDFNHDGIPDIFQLDDVVITGPGNPVDSHDPCDPSSSSYDYYTCNGVGNDSGDPCDPFSSAYDYSICYGNDSGDPCDPFSYAYDYNVCYGNTGGGDPPMPNNCATTCDDGFIQNEDCSCIKKVDDDCKEFKKSKEFEASSILYNPGQVISFEGPFYFSSLAEIPKNIKKDTQNAADLISGYNIIQHGNYYEIPSLNYKFNIQASFAGGSVGGFMGKDCPGDTTPPPTINIYGYSSNNEDSIGNEDTGFYQNTGDFSQNSPLPDDESKAGGLTKADAKQLQSDIFNVLDKSPKFNKFKALITRGVKNNKAYFSKIPQDKLDEALQDLDEGDQKIFATIVANTINSDKPMIVQYFTTHTLLKYTDGTMVSTDYNIVLQLLVLPPKLETVLMGSGDGLTSSELLAFWRSGATTAYNGGTASFLDTTSNYYDEATALHEFFGHGRPVSIESPSTKHNPDDAILFENLVWRLLGKPDKQKNGKNHDKFIVIPNYTTALPSFR